MFIPTLKKPVASIHCGMSVGNLYRFQAVVSNLKEGARDAIQAKLGDTAKLTGFVTPVKEVAGGTLVEGFAVKALETHYINKTELSSKLDSLGAKEVARNMYMDDDETVWSVNVVGDNAIITKNGTDDIEALLASATQRNDYKGTAIQPTVDVANFQPCKVAFIDDTGEVSFGIAVATVDNSTRIQVLSTETPSNEPAIVDAFQVFASEELENWAESEDFDGGNILDYYRTIYSDDPAMMESLEDLTNEITLI